MNTSEKPNDKKELILEVKDELEGIGLALEVFSVEELHILSSALRALNIDITQNIPGKNGKMTNRVKAILAMLTPSVVGESLGYAEEVARQALRNIDSGVKEDLKKILDR